MIIRLTDCKVRVAVRALLAARTEERRTALTADEAILAPGAMTPAQLRAVWEHADASARRERAERVLADATVRAAGIDPDLDADEDIEARLAASVEGLS